MPTLVVVAFYYSDGCVQEEIRGTHLDIFNVCSHFSDTKVIIFSDRDMPEYDTVRDDVPGKYRMFNPTIVPCRNLNDFKSKFVNPETSVDPMSCIFYYSGHATLQGKYCFPDEDVDAITFFDIISQRLHPTRSSILIVQDCCNGPHLNLPYELSDKGSFEIRLNMTRRKNDILSICSSIKGQKSFSSASRGSLFTHYLMEFANKPGFKTATLKKLREYICDSIRMFDDTVSPSVHVYSSIDRLAYVPDGLSG